MLSRKIDTHIFMVTLPSLNKTGHNQLGKKLLKDKLIVRS